MINFLLRLEREKENTRELLGIKCGNANIKSLEREQRGLEKAGYYYKLNRVYVTFCFPRVKSV